MKTLRYRLFDNVDVFSIETDCIELVSYSFKFYAKKKPEIFGLIILN